MDACAASLKVASACGDGYAHCTLLDAILNDDDGGGGTGSGGDGDGGGVAADSDGVALLLSAALFSS